MGVLETSHGRLEKHAAEEASMIRSRPINCSQAIIDACKPNSQGKCGIALGTRESVPGAWSVRVTAESVCFNLGGDHRSGEGTRYHYPLPARAGQWAARLDQHGKAAVRPIKFTLDGRQATSAPVLRRGERDIPYRKRKTHKKSSTTRVCSSRRHAGLAAHSR